MVRDEFLGAAGASGGGGGGSGGVPSYPSAAIVLLGLQRQPNSGYVTIGPGVYRYSTSGLGSKFTFPTGYGTLGSTTNPNFAYGIPQVVMSPQQDCIIGFGPTASYVGVGSQTLNVPFSATFNGSVGSGQPFGAYYNNMPNYGVINAVVINNSSSAVIVGVESTLYARSFNASSGWGGTLNSPATQPSGTIKKIAFAAGESIVLVSTDTAPYLHIYQWSSSGFGAKLSSPSPALPVSTVTGRGNFKVSPSGAVVGYVASTINTPTSQNPNSIQFYSVTSSGLTFLYSYTAVIQGVGGIIGDYHFSPTGGSVVVDYTNDSNIRSYIWADSTGIGNQINLSFTSSSNPVATISSNGAYIAFAYTTSATGFVPTRWVFDLHTYSDVGGIGPQTGSITQISSSDTVTFLGGFYFT